MGRCVTNGADDTYSTTDSFFQMQFLYMSNRQNFPTHLPEIYTQVRNSESSCSGMSTNLSASGLSEAVDEDKVADPVAETSFSRNRTETFIEHQRQLSQHLARLKFRFLVSVTKGAVASTVLRDHPPLIRRV